MTFDGSFEPESALASEATVPRVYPEAFAYVNDTNVMAGYS